MTNFSYLTSDWHLGHTNIIKYSNRPFVTTNQMQETIIYNYNSVVGANSNVLFLGDMFFTKFDIACELTQSLNGNKYLLRGNHDRSFTESQFLRMGFKEVYPTYFKCRIDGMSVYYSHYPFAGYSADLRFESRRPPKDGTVIVHGHTHDTAKLTAKRTVHVGVDAWDCYPAPMEAVAKLVKQAYNDNSEC